MANDRDDLSSKAHDSADESNGEGTKKRVIGRGMTSPDSTQVPLKAETGEPDLEAIEGRVPRGDSDDDESTSRR